VDFTDVPARNPEPGESIPHDQIPYPDWMTAPDEDAADHAVAFRLRGRPPSQALLRQVAGVDHALELADRYAALGWGGDATVTRLADGVVVAEVASPLVADDAPI
jgi:hypothetical protein